MKILEMSYGAFREFIESRGAKIPKSCPSCDSQELWNVDKENPDVVFGQSSFEEIKYIINAPNYKRLDFGHFILECGNCGFSHYYVLAPMVEDWFRKNE